MTDGDGWGAFAHVPELDGLVTRPELLPSALVLLEWVRVRVEKDVASAFPGIETAVVRVTYVGSYPTIGLRGLHVTESERARVLLDAKISEVVAAHRLQDLIAFILATGCPWAERIAAYERDSVLGPSE